MCCAAIRGCISITIIQFAKPILFGFFSKLLFLDAAHCICSPCDCFCFVHLLCAAPFHRCMRCVVEMLVHFHVHLPVFPICDVNFGFFSVSTCLGIPSLMNGCISFCRPFDCFGFVCFGRCCCALYSPSNSLMHLWWRTFKLSFKSDFFSSTGGMAVLQYPMENKLVFGKRTHMGAVFAVFQPCRTWLFSTSPIWLCGACYVK